MTPRGWKQPNLGVREARERRRELRLKACEDCPWLSSAPRDKAALTPELRAAAARGEFFACHTRGGGVCYGAMARRRNP